MRFDTKRKQATHLQWRRREMREIWHVVACRPRSRAGYLLLLQPPLLLHSTAMTMTTISTSTPLQQR
jgi:hypothetical protein